MIHFLLSCNVCTVGEYRTSYLKAVLYAEKKGHVAASKLLRNCRPWDADDEDLYRVMCQSWGDELLFSWKDREYYDARTW